MSITAEIKMNKLATLSDNLNYLLKHAEINSAKLARDLELPAATIKNLRCGDNKNPTLSTLIPIARYFSITVSQLIGESVIAENGNLKSHEATVFIVKVPLLSWEDAASWSTICSETFVNILSEDSADPINFALTVTENDLQNFSENSILLINTTKKVKHKDFVIVQKNEQKAVLRQFLDEGDGVYLKPLVKEALFIPWTDAHVILGVVCSFQKKLK